uniref:RRM domain-containing protein n=1 Tax=Onchocerca volvulus TaxID=6282 RepID=A0A8R1XXT2_ONCVO
MQFHGEKRSTTAADCGKLKQSDLHLPQVGTSEDRTLYVQNIPGTWDKWKLLNIFRRFGRIDNIKILKKHEDSLTCAFVYMMTVADANSVITATANNDGEIQLPELSKPLKIQFVKQKGDASSKTELLTAINKEAERMKRLRIKKFFLIVHIKICFSYFSTDRVELGLTGGMIRKSIIYNDRLHRHAYLPVGKPLQIELVKPIAKFLHWPMLFYVTTETHECEAENLIITNRDLDSNLVAHFKRAAQVTYVVENELLVAAPNKAGQVPLRCRVLEELNDKKIRIYALDLGQTLVVQMSDLKVISDYLASIPARAVPCTLYGITNPTSTFAQNASCLLESIDHLLILVVSFQGAIALVRAFSLNGNGSSEIAKILANKDLCDYKPPSKRRTYSRETLLFLREKQVNAYEYYCDLHCLFCMNCIMYFFI